MRKVAFLGMTKRVPGNTGSKEEQFLLRQWLEPTMRRLCKEQETLFLFPASSLFDLEAMRVAVHIRRRGKLYLPSEAFQNRAPAHIRAAMSAMAMVGGVYYGSDRRQRMIEEADVLVLFTDKDEPHITPLIGKKSQIVFPWEQYQALLDVRQTL